MVLAPPRFVAKMVRQAVERSVGAVVGPTTTAGPTHVWSWSPVWGMIAEDADGDGRITPVDRAIVEAQQGRSGYQPGDVDLDGDVD